MGSETICMSAESPLEFVDTNILVYAHDSSAGEKGRIARELVLRLWTRGTGCLSVQVMQELYVTLTRKVAHPLSSDRAEEILRDLSYWRLHAPNALDVLSAIDLQRRYQLSFWDAMVITSAGVMGCDTLWSEDFNPEERYNGVRVKNPFQDRSA
jgi:predicted nucleic acid-binding protein